MLIVHLRAPYRPYLTYTHFPEGLRYIANSAAYATPASIEAARKQDAALYIVVGELYKTPKDLYPDLPKFDACFYLDETEQEYVDSYYQHLLCLLNNPTRVQAIADGQIAVRSTGWLRELYAAERAAVLRSKKYVMVPTETRLYEKLGAWIKRNVK